MNPKLTPKQIKILQGPSRYQPLLNVTAGASREAQKLAQRMITTEYSPVTQLKRHTADIEAFKRKAGVA